MLFLFLSKSSSFALSLTTFSFAFSWSLAFSQAPPLLFSFFQTQFDNFFLAASAVAALFRFQYWSHIRFEGRRYLHV